METEKIEERIRKLLAKARGTDNEAEAAAFTAKAHALLAEHNLQEESVLRRGLGAGEVVSSREIRTAFSAGWVGWIYKHVARLYFCRAYTIDRTVLEHGGLREVRHVVLAGRPHNVAVAESMADYLCATVARLAKQYARDRRTAGNYMDEGHLFALWAGFEEGCACRLAERVREMADAARAPAPASPSGGLPALYRSEDADIEKFLSDAGVRLRKGPSTQTYGARDAQNAGFSAGDGVSLAPQVPGAATHLIGSR